MAHERLNAQGAPEPRADRPDMPAAYGVPKGRKGLLPWRWAEERLERAQSYWVATVRPDGRPHTVPVWGLWLERTFYFGGQGVKARNLAANPRAAVHLESADEVVIVEGVCEQIVPDADLRARLAAASEAKYGFGGGDEEGEPTYALRPRLVLAWQPALKGATRWRFDFQERPAAG